MKVRVYEEGCESGGHDYEQSPRTAAEDFAYDHLTSRSGGRATSFNVCVVPLDDEARALGGWHSDEDSPEFRMYVVTGEVTTTWSSREVESFNPNWKPKDGPHG